ncbi:hypothetical protein N9J72_00725 [Candidatus Gracilibacteria bacterium]|nr:hypothetical protein [Candidatus Gracilibacteria bacterium]
MEKHDKKVEPKHLHTGPSFLEKQENINAIAYIPYLVGPALAFFLGKTDKRMLKHHIKYSLVFFLIALILTVILADFFKGITTICYIVVSGYFAYKAYSGELIKIDVFDTVEEKIHDKMGK